MPEISWFHLAGLFFLALSAGTIDAIAGGGGLLTVPGLIAAGLPPLPALATNKAQAIFSSLTATIHFVRKGKLRLRDFRVSAVASMLGAIVGAACISHMPADVLTVLVPALLICIALWLTFSPRLGATAGKARIPAGIAAFTAVPLIGAYDGFFGPGAGTFFAIALVWLLGLKLEEATWRTKLYNLMSNLGALLFFLAQGHIVWRIAAVMAVGTIIGGTIGARLVLSHGAKVIRPLLAAVSIAVSLKLLWQEFG